MIDKVRYSNRSQETTKMIRIKQYSYRRKDLLGEGYSSKVYKGKNNTKSTNFHIKIRRLPLKLSIKKPSIMKSIKFFCRPKFPS